MRGIRIAVSQSYSANSQSIRYTICFATQKPLVPLVSLTYPFPLSLCVLDSLICLSLFPIYHYNYNVTSSRTLVFCTSWFQWIHFQSSLRTPGDGVPTLLCHSFFHAPFKITYDLLIMQWKFRYPKLLVPEN